MHRVGDRARDGSVELVSAEELLLELAQQAGPDGDLTGRVVDRLVEALGDRREPARGATGSARAAQADALHGLTHVAPGNPVVFADVERREAAS